MLLTTKSRIVTFMLIQLILRVPLLHSMRIRSTASYIHPLRMTSSDTTARGKVIVIAGPTAVGKSRLALNLCKRMSGEIISVDSVQVYRYLDIGSNKPSLQERQEIPHHLIDIADANTERAFTAGEFVRKAEEAIDDVLRRGKVPVVVGGTSMYTQWLVQGLPDAPKSDPQTEKKARELLQPYREKGDWEGAIALMASHNSQRASRLSKNDWYRLERALEVVLMTPENVESFTGIRRPLQDKYDFRCFFLISPRQELCQIIDKRCLEMIEKGLLEETSDLLMQGILQPGSPPSRALGYRQAMEFLQGGFDDEEEAEAAFRTFMEEFATGTRRYAKQQMVWFRAQAEFIWVRWNLQDMSAVEKEVLLHYEKDAPSYQSYLENSLEQRGLREENVQEGKDMKLYVSKVFQGVDKAIIDALVHRASLCRLRVRQDYHNSRGEMGGKETNS